MIARSLLWQYTAIMGVNWCLFCCQYLSVHISVTSGIDFDGSSLTYNPQGRVLQMEYAMLATSKRQVCSAVGLAGRRCAVIAARKQISNDEKAKRSYRPQLLWDIDDHITLVCAGLRSDVQYIADLSRRICMEHMYVWDSPIPCHVFATRIADAVHDCTRSDSKRPLAVDIIVAGLDVDGGHPIIIHISPAGALYPMRACAVGAHADEMIEPLVKWVTLSSDNNITDDEENTVLSLHALMALAHVTTENEEGPDFSLLSAEDFQLRVLNEGGGKLLSEAELDILIEKLRYDYKEHLPPPGSSADASSAISNNSAQRPT